MIGKIFAYLFKAQINRIKEMLIKNPSPLYILESNYYQSQARISSFQGIIKYPQLRTQLIECNFIEVLVRDCLPDKKHLSIDLTEKYLEMLPVSEIFPIRSEAIIMILDILENKDICKELFENLISMIQIHKIISNEIKNSQDTNVFLRISSITFIQDLITYAEFEINSIIVQTEAIKSLKVIFEANHLFREQFPGLEEYLNRYQS